MMCQYLPSGQPMSRSRTPCCLHLTPHSRVRHVSALGTHKLSYPGELSCGVAFDLPGSVNIIVVPECALNHTTLYHI